MIARVACLHYLLYFLAQHVNIAYNNEGRGLPFLWPIVSDPCVEPILLSVYRWTIVGLYRLPLYSHPPTSLQEIICFAGKLKLFCRIVRGLRIKVTGHIIQLKCMN